MGNQKSTPTNFVATVYGNLTPLNNSAFSQARLKIFYKGLNRNGSYITDEIAEQLLATLPGTPIVGYFRGENDDFDGHIAPEENKAYGFVPESMNFKWEMSLDPDGVYRTYACVDVVLWTGRYPIASRIVGKSHSMELNPDTVRGEWEETEEYGFVFKFSFAEFFGLCVLGEEYEPCFEGSSFYELKKDNKISNMKEDLKEMFSLFKQEQDTANIQTGGQQMEDKEKDLEKELPETPAEEEKEEKVPTEGTEEEKETPVEQEEEEKEEPEQKEEKDEEEENGDDEDNEEEEEKEEENEGSEELDLNSQLAEKDKEINSLKAQLEELNTYKNQKVKEEKEKVIEAYSKKLTEEEVNNFKGKIDEFESAVELKKEIALCILDKELQEQETDESNFALVNNKSELNGVEAIVAKYAKK